MPPTASLRVLYVEDDRVAGLLFSQAVLADPGIELRVAEDGAEALALTGVAAAAEGAQAKAAAWLPDVLVLDAHLPDTSGHDLLARLRAWPPLARVPAIMCSADCSAEDLQRAAESGFNRCWAKPLVLRELPAQLHAMQADAQLAAGRVSPAAAPASGR